MGILVLNHSDVSSLLSMSECVDVMTEALSALARGEVFQPLRTAAVAPGAKGVLGLMPAYRGGDQPAYGLKAVCVFQGNSARGLDIHQGAVLLFSGDTGRLLALMDASAITAIRTAAVSAIATRLLAREDAVNLAIIGAGVEARTHLESMGYARPIKHCKIASRGGESARQLAIEYAEKVSFPLEAAANVKDAVADADIIVTATTSREPVLDREWIAPGAHINLVGSSVRSMREADTATMAAGRLFVDRRESTLNEAGDYLFAAREGAIGPEHIKGEIGEILIGQNPGRTSAEEITVFKSLGLALEDLACAQYLYKKAADLETGNWMEF